MGFVKEGNRRAAERGHRLMTQEFAEKNGHVYRIKDISTGNAQFSYRCVPEGWYTQTTIVAWNTGEEDNDVN